MAIPALPQPAGQEVQATTETPGPGRSPLRERFDNLPERAKELILTKYRDWNTEHIDWWDSVYDLFKQDMDNIGVDVDRMYFSGFWSQGDGACFEGSVREWGVFLQSLGYTDPALIKHAADHFRLSVEHRGYYYHENCTSFCVDLPLPCHNEDEEFITDFLPAAYERGSLHEAVWVTLLANFDSSKLEEEFTEALRNHMRELYTRLEAEYDYLTSDDAVLDALEAYDMLEDLITDAITEENEYA